MEIKFMRKLKSFLEKYPKEGMGIELKELNLLNKQTDKNFPLSYQEFLITSGSFFDLMANFGHRSIFSVERNQKARENMMKFGVSIDRDFWVIAELDASMIIFFFYFDEGDNPPIYKLDLNYYSIQETIKEETKIYGAEYVQDLVEYFNTLEKEDTLCKRNNSFSEFINEFIDNYIPNPYH